MEAFVANTVVAEGIVVWDTGCQVVTSIGTVETSLARKCQSRTIRSLAFLTIETALCVDAHLIKGAVVSISDTFVKVLTVEAVSHEATATGTLRCSAASSVGTDRVFMAIVTTGETPKQQFRYLKTD